MATLAELLPFIVQPLAGPALPAIAKSPVNVTGGSPSAPRGPAEPNIAQMIAALTGMQNSAYENKLRDAQVQQVQQQLAFGKMLPDLLNNAMMGGGASGGAQGIAPAVAPASAPASSFGSLAPAGDVPPGAGGNLANFNFGGMRVPGAPDRGGPLTNPAGWQKFDSPEAGVAAIARQLDRYASGATTGTPLTTIRKIVSTWAPPHENPTEVLIERASRVVGVGPDVPLDMSNPAVKAKLVEATIRNEQGGKLPVGMDVIGRVVGGGQPTGSSTFGALAPGGVSANAAIPMTPQQQAIVRLGVTSRLAKLGDIAVPLEHAYYNSPTFKAGVAGAEETAKRGAGWPFFQAEQTLQSDLARRNALAGQGMELAPDGSIRPIAGFSPTQAATAGAKAGAETGAQEAARQPYTQANAQFQTQLDIAKQNAAPVTLQPGQTTIIDPSRVHLPQPLGAPLRSGLAPAQPLAAAPITLQGRAPAEVEFEQKLGQTNAAQFFERKTQAEDAVKSMRGSIVARELLDGGMITGTGANWRLSAAKALATVGLTDGATVANTEAYMAARARDVLNLVKGLGSATAISDADREFANRMAAGQIDLSETGMRKILDLLDRYSRETIDRHNRDAERLPPELSKYPLTVPMPEMKPRASGTTSSGVKWSVQ